MFRYVAAWFMGFIPGLIAGLKFSQEKTACSSFSWSLLLGIGAGVMAAIVKV